MIADACRPWQSHHMPGGTAPNEALRENVFVMVVCICNSLPLFLVGKPGCSKSLSVQLIADNLLGEGSADPFFRTLPRVVVLPFQGSEDTTSEQMVAVFERAHHYAELNKHESVMPLVLLDEARHRCSIALRSQPAQLQKGPLKTTAWHAQVGLAELSRHNPLKVLHSRLESDILQAEEGGGQEAQLPYAVVGAAHACATSCSWLPACDIVWLCASKEPSLRAAAGISNWELDAAKMNRAIHLVCARPADSPAKIPRRRFAANPDHAHAP